MVSILLAAYNGSRFLPEQLASLQAQTQGSFRVLWQDDGSSDGTDMLLQDISRTDSRFVPGTMHGQHLGPIGNFLSLLQQDDAPYTALCDQDDVWQPDKLQRCLSALQSAEAQLGAEAPILVHHDCRIVSADGSVLHDSFFHHQGWNGAATALSSLLVQNNVTGCTCLMNAALRRLVAKHAQADAIFMHDWFIALTAAAFGQIIFVNAPLVNYRQHGRNVMGASRTGLVRRGLKALRTPEAARARIILTYQQARSFRDAFGASLPPASHRVISQYLAIESLPKLQRIRALRKGGYLLQSRITRFGQYLFI